jgi:hypothetical protein
MLRMLDGCHISGELNYTVLRGGEAIGRYSERNMIMTLGRVAVARLFAGLPGGNGAKIGVGEDGSPVSPEQTSLTNQSLVEASTIGFAQAVTADGILSWVPSDTATPNVRFEFGFGPNDANGLSIMEFGLFTHDGVMFARRIRASGKPIGKDEDLSIEGYWIIRF